MRTLIYLLLLAALGCSVAQGQVISEPGDVTVCEGREAVFTCVLNGNMSSDDVQWYRFIKDTNTTEIVDPDGENIMYTAEIEESDNENTTSSSLTITNVIKFDTGYFWVGTPSLNVCNASLTVTKSPPALKVTIMTTIESSSIVIRWKAVEGEDLLITTYTITWFNSGTRDFDSHSQAHQTSYIINGLTLNTVYIITAFVQNDCGTGPKFTTSVMLSASTTSTTSSITPTVTASTNPVTIVSTVYTSMINPSTTSTILMNPSTTSTNSMITASTITVINIAETATTTVSNPFITISTNTLLLSTSPAETNMAIKNSDSSNIPIIAGAAIGGIIALTIIIVLILFIIFCCFQQRKDTEKNNYSDLSGDDTLTKGIPVALSQLNANDKSEVDSSHQISTTTEGLYMTSDIENKKPPPYKPIESAPQNGRKDTQHQQLMEYAVIDIGNKKKGDKQQNGGTDTKHQQPMEYAVVDKSKKKNWRGGKQQDVEAAHDDVAVLSDTDHTKANQNKNNPMLQYADLEVLPRAVGTRVIRDDSYTQYALVAEM